jgi:hypothetical protein
MSFTLRDQILIVQIKVRPLRGLKLLLAKSNGYYCMRSRTFILLSLGAMWFVSCQENPFGGSYTRSKPNKAYLIGTWVPRQATFKNLKEDGGYDVSKADIKLVLREDDSFELKDMPDWWDDPFGKSLKNFRSSVGKWALTNNTDGNTWEIALYTTTRSRFVNLLGEKSPYTLHFIIGDPDEGRAMVFIKQSE